MKKVWALLLLMSALCGCASNSADLDRVLVLRSKLLNIQKCSFDAIVYADYGKQVHTFTLACNTDINGKLDFSVAAPESISGITGYVDAAGGKLTFDDQALAFELLADDQFSPVSAPWLLMKTLRGGYIVSCGPDGDYLMASIDDSYADDALRLDIWINGSDQPVGAEVLWNNRRILSMEIKNFQLL